MPTISDLQHMPSRDLARLHEFFASYRPKVAEDQPWANKQLRQITDEMAARPAMSDEPEKQKP